MNLYESYKLVFSFVKELWNIDLLGKPSARLNDIKELRLAYDALQNQISANSPSFSDDFIEKVFPLLENGVEWNLLKEKGLLNPYFIKRCKSLNLQSDFYGTLFEVDMACRFLLTGWKVAFVEKKTSLKKQIDFIATNQRGKKIGVECTSKRMTRELTIEKINETIGSKEEKFYQKNISGLGQCLDKKVLVIDITQERYECPKITHDLSLIDIGKIIDVVFLTWKEDKREGSNHHIVWKYSKKGQYETEYLTATLASEFRVDSNGSPVFFMRKYVEPEPQHGSWGCEERNPTVDDY